MYIHLLDFNELPKNVYKIVYTNDDNATVWKNHNIIYAINNVYTYNVDCLRETQKVCELLNRYNESDQFIHCNNIDSFSELLDAINKLGDELLKINKKYDTDIIEIIKYFMKESKSEKLKINENEIQNLHKYDEKIYKIYMNEDILVCIKEDEDWIDTEKYKYITICDNNICERVEEDIVKEEIADCPIINQDNKIEIITNQESGNVCEIIKSHLEGRFVKYFKIRESEIQNIRKSKGCGGDYCAYPIDDNFFTCTHVTEGCNYTGEYKYLTIYDDNIHISDKLDEENKVEAIVGEKLCLKESVEENKGCTNISDILDKSTEKCELFNSQYSDYHSIREIIIKHENGKIIKLIKYCMKKCHLDCFKINENEIQNLRDYKMNSDAFSAFPIGDFFRCVRINVEWVDTGKYNYLRICNDEIFVSDIFDNIIPNIKPNKNIGQTPMFSTNISDILDKPEEETFISVEKKNGWPNTFNPQEWLHFDNIINSVDNKDITPYNCIKLTPTIGPVQIMKAKRIETDIEPQAGISSEYSEISLPNSSKDKYKNKTLEEIESMRENDFEEFKNTSEDELDFSISEEISSGIGNNIIEEEIVDEEIIEKNNNEDVILFANNTILDNTVIIYGKEQCEIIKESGYFNEIQLLNEYIVPELDAVKNMLQVKYKNTLKINSDTIEKDIVKINDFLYNNSDEQIKNYSDVKTKKEIVQDFMNTYCVKKVGSKIYSNTLYAQFQEYLLKKNEIGLTVYFNKNNFTPLVKNIGYTTKRNGSGIHWIDIDFIKNIDICKNGAGSLSTYYRTFS